MISRPRNERVLSVTQDSNINYPGCIPGETTLNMVGRMKKTMANS